jgi:hypothetical protein
VERRASRGVPTRRASRASNFAFDWDDQSTWGATLDGVAAAYVTEYARRIAASGV